MENLKEECAKRYKQHECLSIDSNYLHRNLDIKSLSAQSRKVSSHNIQRASWNKVFTIDIFRLYVRSTISSNFYT